MELLQVRLDDPVVTPLLDGLTEEYRARYGEVEEMARAGAADFEPPSGMFLALVKDGQVLAGGGFRRLEADVCEVKRMWTTADHRGRGHASTVLRALEAAARAAGYRTAWLETGPTQPEAAAMYTAYGYRRIPTYGPYPQALAFARRLL